MDPVIVGLATFVIVSTGAVPPVTGAVAALVAVSVAPVVAQAPLVVDTRNATHGVTHGRDKIVKA